MHKYKVYMVVKACKSTHAHTYIETNSVVNVVTICTLYANNNARFQTAVNLSIDFNGNVVLRSSVSELD